MPDQNLSREDAAEPAYELLTIAEAAQLLRARWSGRGQRRPISQGTFRFNV